MTQLVALVVILDGVEEIEALAPVDCLRRAGVEVTLAATGDTLQVTGRNNIGITADTTLENCVSRDYDLVVIPGGPGHAQLCNNTVVLDLLRKQNRRGGLIGSICAGPVVLHRAGVLQGRNFTSFPSTQEVLPLRDATTSVVRDGNLITAQGAGCSIEFSLKLVEALCGTDLREQISKSICYQEY